MYDDASLNIMLQGKISHVGKASSNRCNRYGLNGWDLCRAFAEAGFDTVAIDTWAEHITAITENGLFLSGASGDRKISGITASTDIAAARNADLFIIATKASGVAAAASAISIWRGLMRWC